MLIVNDFNNISIALVSVFCLGVAWFYLRKKKDFILPNIPVIPSTSSLFGLTKYGSIDIMFPAIEKDGPILQFTCFGRHVVVVNDPVLARKALRDVHGKGFFQNPNPHVIELNTFNVDTGPEWTKRRNTFRKAFSTMCLRLHVNSITTIVNRIADVLDKACDTKQVVRIDDVFQQLTIEIICKMAFELDISDEKSSELSEAFKSIFEERWILLLPFSYWILRLPFDPFRKRKVSGQKFDMFKKEILTHIKSLDAKGILPKDSLAESVLKFSELPGISEKYVLSEIGLFFLAGMDTTAHTMALAIYSLAANPNVQKKAQLVMDEFNASSDKPDPCSSGGIPEYVEAILKESMRKYPTASTGSFRKVRDEEGYTLSPEIVLPKESWILVNIYALQNSVKIWGPDAKEFKPERFLNDESTKSDKPMGNDRSEEIDPLDGNANHGKGNPLSSHSAFAGVGRGPEDIRFIPFSFGLRNCVGMNLALMELRVGLCQLISRFHFELADPAMKDDEFMFETHFTSRPINGLPVIITRRGSA